MNKFKFNDKVYFPRIGLYIFTLEENDINSQYFKISHGNVVYTFTKDGKHSQSEIIPSIFHATDKNRVMLNDMYNLDFQSPMETITYDIATPFIPEIGDPYWYITPITSVGYACCRKEVVTTPTENMILSLGVYRTEEQVRTAFNNQRQAISELNGSIK